MFFLNKNYEICKYTVPSREIQESHRSKYEKFIVSVSVNGKGHSKNHVSQRNKNNCTIEIEANKEVKVVCPDQSVNLFHIDDPSQDCPFINYWLSSELAASLCRMTLNPWWALLFIYWIISGMKLIAFFVDLIDFIFLSLSIIF